MICGLKDIILLFELLLLMLLFICAFGILIGTDKFILIFGLNELFGRLLKRKGYDKK